MHTHAHTYTHRRHGAVRGSPPLSVFIAAVLQSDKRNKGFITGRQLVLQPPLVFKHQTSGSQRQKKTINKSSSPQPAHKSATPTNSSRASTLRVHRCRCHFNLLCAFLNYCYSLQYIQHMQTREKPSIKLLRVQLRDNMATDDQGDQMSDLMGLHGISIPSGPHFDWS